MLTFIFSRLWFIITDILNFAESDYQDPSSLACTGPPGTPSPIRDALDSPLDDPSTSEIYADVETDGKSADLPEEQNM